MHNIENYKLPERSFSDSWNLKTKQGRYIFRLRNKFPYCFHRKTNGAWIALHRDYKPVAFDSREWVDYETVAVPEYRFTPENLAAIAALYHNGRYVDDLNEGYIWLYSDGCKPWDSKRNLARYEECLKALGLAGAFGSLDKADIDRAARIDYLLS